MTIWNPRQSVRDLLSQSLLTLALGSALVIAAGCDSSAPTSSDATVTTEPGVEVSAKTPPAPPTAPATPDQ